jgi:archaellum component FlaC
MPNLSNNGKLLLEPAKIGESLLNLANETDELDPYAADRLRLLREAVLNRTYASALAKLDIYAMVNVDLVVDQYRSKRGGTGGLIDTLELVRNVLIFVPIIGTWASIAGASLAYHNLLSQCLKSCPDQVAQPFLYLWEQGFSGRLPDILRLSSIGIFDASVVGCILLLTAFIILLANVRNNGQARKAQAFQSRLVRALADTTLYLHETSPVFVAPHENLDDAAKRVDAMSQNVLTRFDGLADRLVQQFETTTQQMGQQFGATAQQMQQQFGATTQQMQQQFSGIASRFGSVAQQLSEQLTNIEQEFARQLQTSNTHLTALGNILGNFGQLSTEMKTAASSLQRANSELSQSMNNLLGPVKDLSQQQDGLLQAVTKSVADLDGIVTGLNALDRQQKQWITQFMDTIEVLEVSIGKIDNIVSGLSDSNKQQKSFLAELAQEREQQLKLTESMTEAAAAIKNVLTGLDDGATNLRSMAADVKRVLQLQAAVTNANQMDVTNIVNGYTGAARSIEKSGQILDAAGTVMYEAATSLQQVIQEMEKRFTTI